MIVRTFDSIGRRLREQCLGPVCLFLLLGFTHSVWAAPLTAWDFASNSGNELESPATFVAPGFQTTLITRGGTQDPFFWPGTFANKAWPANPPDGFFEFSISSLGGSYTLSDILFNLLTQPLGPNTWRLTTGSGAFLDEWTAFPGLSDTPSTHTSILPASPDFQNVTGSKTFRLYGFNSSGGAAGLTSLSINGSTSVPESLPLGAFGLTAGLLLFVRSRVKA
jgi:hypothetical protein